MILSKFIFCVFYTIFVGYVFIKYTVRLKKINKIYIIPVSYILGIGLISWQMLMLSLLNIKFGLLTLLFPWIIFLSSVLKDIKNIKLISIGIKPKKNILNIILVGIILIQLLLIFSRFIIHPKAIGWDAVGIWYYKAKVFSTDRIVNFDFFLNKNLLQEGITDTYMRSSYPISLPLYISFVFMSIGEFDIFWGNLVWAVLYIFLLWLLISYISNKHNLFESLIFIILFITLPANFDHLAGKYAGYADLPLMCVITASTVLFLSWLKTINIKYLILSLVLSAIAMNIKEDGLVFFIIILVLSIVSSIVNHKYEELLKYIYLPLSVALPWYFIRDALQFPSLLDGSTGIHYERIIFIFKNLFIQFLNTNNFILLLPLFVFTFYLSFVNRLFKSNIYLLAIIFTIIFSYVAVFVMTPLDPYKHILSLADRMLYSVSPLIIMFISDIFRFSRRKKADSY